MEATTIVLVVAALGALIAGIWALWYFFLRKPSEKDVRIYQAEERLSWLKQLEPEEEDSQPSKKDKKETQILAFPKCVWRGHYMQEYNRLEFKLRRIHYRESDQKHTYSIHARGEDGLGVFEIRDGFARVIQQKIVKYAFVKVYNHFPAPLLQKGWSPTAAIEYRGRGNTDDWAINGNWYVDGCEQDPSRSGTFAITPSTSENESDSEDDAYYANDFVTLSLLGMGTFGMMSMMGSGDGYQPVDNPDSGDGSWLGGGGDGDGDGDGGFDF